MRPLELLLLAGLGPLLALAMDDIESNDFPISCRPACQPAVDLSERCDRTTNDDRAEQDCVCQAPNARAQFEACAACVKAAPLRPDDDDDNDDDDRDDGDDDNGQEDLGKLMRLCNWDIQSVSPSTGGGPAATTPTPSPSASGGSGGGGGGVVTTSVTDANGRPTMSTVTPAAGATGTGGAPGDSAGSLTTPRLALALGGAGMLWGLQAWL